MPYGIRATLATSHESARRGFKYWISEIGVEINLGNCRFIGLSTSRKMISFWSSMSCFRAFEIGLFFPDTHQRLSFPNKLGAKLCLEQLDRIIQDTVHLTPVLPVISIPGSIRRAAGEVT